MIIRLLFALAAVLVVSDAGAATFCVNSAATLQSALTAAQTNNEDDVIELTIGTYVPTQSYGFSYSSVEPHSLTLAGGYISLFGSPCSAYLQDAKWSVIDGNATHALLVMYANASAGNEYLTLARLTFRNGSDAQFSGPLVDVETDGSATNAVMLDHVVMRDNGSSQAQIYVKTGGRIVVQNSVFVDNTIHSGTNKYEIATLQSYNPTGPSGGVVFNGNTVANNINTGVPGNAQFFIRVNDGPLNVANSIFWGNTGTDLAIEVNGSATMLVSDSDIGAHQFGGTGSFATTNLYSIDPAFIGNGDYRLAGNSLLRDLGDNFAVGGIGSYDAAGQTRIVFGRVDLGAYEVQDSIFKNGFQ